MVYGRCAVFVLLHVRVLLFLCCRVAASPNSEYLLVSWLSRPFSTSVPAGRFPVELQVSGDMHDPRRHALTTCGMPAIHPHMVYTVLEWFHSPTFCKFLCVHISVMYRCPVLAASLVSLSQAGLHACSSSCRPCGVILLCCVVSTCSCGTVRASTSGPWHHCPWLRTSPSPSTAAGQVGSSSTSPYCAKLHEHTTAAAAAA